MAEDRTPYWCTCADNPKTCKGCQIDALVESKLGTDFKIFLVNRTNRFIKPAQSGKRRQ